MALNCLFMGDGLVEVCPARYRVNSLRKCLESFSTRLSFSTESLDSKP